MWTMWEQNRCLEPISLVLMVMMKNWISDCEFSCILYTHANVKTKKWAVVRTISKYYRKSIPFYAFDQLFLLVEMTNNHLITYQYSSTICSTPEYTYVQLENNSRWILHVLIYTLTIVTSLWRFSRTFWIMWRHWWPTGTLWWTQILSTAKWTTCLHTQTNLVYLKITFLVRRQCNIIIIEYIHCNDYMI